MKLLTLTLSLISSIAFAETATVTVKGMHCAGCKESVTKSVCGDEKIAKTAESCTVKITDAKKELGEITVVSKEKVDVDAIKTQVADAGYKVAKIDVKDVIVKPAMVSDSAAVVEESKGEPNTKVVTTTTTVETAITDAAGNTEVKKEVKVKKIKKALGKNEKTEKKDNK